MGASDVELVRELFRRFGHAGLDSALELISEDAVFEIPGTMSAEPDVYEGHDGARRYFAGFEGLLDELRFEPLDFEEGNGAVTMWIRFRGRGVTSGIEVEQYAAINVWVADGKVVRMTPHPDMESARAELR
jgi:ketosteroid isomerase-like protein